MIYLPVVYKEFQTQFSKIAKTYDELADKCYDWGALDEKDRATSKAGYIHRSKFRGWGEAQLPGERLKKA